MTVSRLAIVAKYFVVCCYQVTKVYSSKWGLSPMRLLHGAFAILVRLISVIREMNMNTVVTKILTSLCSRF